jgi:hypothetical protein
MGTHRWLAMAGILLLASAAFAQADQQVPSPPSPAPVPVPGRPPQSVADAARAARDASESAAPTKVYRNKDVRDRADQSSAVANQNSPFASPAKTSDQVFTGQERQIESQGSSYKSQILAQEAKIVAIQNHIDELQSQFADWTTWHTDVSDVSLCWTDLGTTYYYKDYCDVGKGLRAQAESAQRDLVQEKARLADMQEYIRHQGYGNAVYEPDE